jgi:hypothetical protein
METSIGRISDEAVPDPGVDPLALVTDGGGLRSGSRRLRLLDGCGLSRGISPVRQAVAGMAAICAKLPLTMYIADHDGSTEIESHPGRSDRMLRDALDG